MKALKITNISNINHLLALFWLESTIPDKKDLELIKKAIRESLSVGAFVLVDDVEAPNCFIWVKYSDAIVSKRKFAYELMSFVVPDKRKKGLFRSLLDAAKMIAQKDGATDFIVETQLGEEYQEEVCKKLGMIPSFTYWKGTI